MKIAESWLREWVDPALDTEALGHQLTMLGHEVDGIEIAGQGIEGVVVAEVLDVESHPNADRLRVCHVSTGDGQTVEVVCGAPNVVKGMKSPLALPGMTLPNGTKLRKSKIRGVVSNGMLCSSAELGLGDESDGIIALPQDAPPGMPLIDYLQLPDAIFDLNLTPNRGDCFCVQGIARDVSALTGAEFTPPNVDTVSPAIEDVYPVEVLEPAGCPVFAGRMIRNIDPGATSPVWMVERLRRAGLRSIHPVVDVTNYVMLELGQPLHAYDLDLLRGAIRPRLARHGETVNLLDQRDVSVNDDTLVITDDSGVIGLAGIMGGSSTAVSENTSNIFFEAAYWPPAHMAGRARSYGMHTDASMRFERGVDPAGQGRAIERATALLLAVSGGDAGPLNVVTATEFLPARPTIRLRRTYLAKLLGATIDDDLVFAILNRLELAATANADGWEVTPPSHRFDIEIEEDLIEEVARIHGYDNIPETTAIAEAALHPATETRVDLERVVSTLVARDFQEVITYSFVDGDAERRVTGKESALRLSNPISSEMAVMRSTLWPGLLDVAARNKARQHDRVRIFEIGKSFHGTDATPREVVRLAGLVSGAVLPEQWGAKPRSADVFDIKSDINAVLSLACDASKIGYARCDHPALQPGLAATILRNGESIGIVGKLHPKIASKFDLKGNVYLFEIDAENAMTTDVPVAKPISRFPVIRRDIAVIVDENVSADDLMRVAAGAAPTLVTDVTIFDVYHGKGIEAGRKSVAIGLILQETSRTLTDDDADAAQAAAVQKLQQEFAAVLRD